MKILQILIISKMAALLFSYEKIHGKFEALKSSYNLNQNGNQNQWKKNNTLFKSTIFNEGLQNGGKQNSVALLISDLEI